MCAPRQPLLSPCAAVRSLVAMCGLLVNGMVVPHFISPNARLFLRQFYKDGPRRRSHQDGPHQGRLGLTGVASVFAGVLSAIQSVRGES